MADVSKLLYIVVLDDDDDGERESSSSFRYTRSVLQGTLQLMGCKARHAFKVYLLFIFLLMIFLRNFILNWNLIYRKRKESCHLI